jgi:hypothetical protein
MTIPGWSSIPANACVVVSSRVAEDVAQQVDKLAAEWKLDRSHAIAAILETAVVSEKVQQAVKVHMWPIELPVAHRYRVVRGGVIKHFDGYSYQERRYEVDQVLDVGGFPDGYVRGLHLKGTILLEALPD